MATTIYIRSPIALGVLPGEPRRDGRLSTETFMSQSTDINDAVLELLAEKITSFEQLEILLLLRRHQGEALSAVSTAHRLRISDGAAEEAMAHLHRHGLVAERGEDGSALFSYHPGNAALAQTVDQLAALYEQNSLVVIKQMSANSLERVRMEAIRTFADAFLIGKGKKNG